MLRDSYHEIEMQYTCLEEVPRTILKRRPNTSCAFLPYG